MKRILTVLPYALLLFIMFLGLPAFSFTEDMKLMLLFFVMPLICLASGVVITIVKEFMLSFPLFVGVAYLIGYLVHMDFYHLVYILLYILAGFCGMMIGCVIDWVSIRK